MAEVLLAGVQAATVGTSANSDQQGCETKMNSGAFPSIAIIGC